MVLLDEKLKFRAVCACRKQTDAGLAWKHARVRQMRLRLEGVRAGQWLIGQIQQRRDIVSGAIVMGLVIILPQTFSLLTGFAFDFTEDVDAAFAEVLVFEDGDLLFFAYFMEVVHVELADEG